MLSSPPAMLSNTPQQWGPCERTSCVKPAPRILGVTVADAAARTQSFGGRDTAVSTPLVITRHPRLIPMRWAIVAMACNTPLAATQTLLDPLLIPNPQRNGAVTQELRNRNRWAETPGSNAVGSIVRQQPA